MGPVIRRMSVVFALLVGMVWIGSAAAPASPPVPDSATAFWTHARVARAIPRDFVLDRGTFGPAAKPDNPGGGGGGKPGGGGDSGTITGASWTGGGVVAGTTGKVLFALGSSYYVCSASTVTETAAGRSLVLTAGHCAYDETNGVFATNWVFIPDYDAAPAPLSTSQAAYCPDTLYGCWEAQSLVVDDGFASAGGFNEQAILHDFAFAVLGNGGNAGGDDLVEELVGTQAIAFSAVAGGQTVDAFGYPAAQKYKGSDLVYCEGPLGFDPYMSDQTYRLGCEMTGGSSGGPWFSSFSAASGTGTLSSLNSYGYSGVKAMHGPKFNSDTQAVYNTARTAPGNTIVGG